MATPKTWRLRDVARAVDMKPRALRQCFETGSLKLTSADKKSNGSGTYIGLSLQRAYQAAVMRDLNKVGLSIPHAARLAHEFSDVGSVGRAPAALFPCGKTYLVIGPDGAMVKNAFHDTPAADLNADGTCLLVDLNRVIDRVDSILKETYQ